MTRHKLIFFYGAGPGTGKSTLSYFTYRQLALNGVKTRCVFESDVLQSQAFAPYVAAVGEERGDDAQTLLAACEDFLRECRDADRVHIVDSILPCTDWLTAAGCAREEIYRFSRALNERLKDLDPLWVLLTGDIGVSFERAVVRRGRAWAEALAKERGREEGVAGLVGEMLERRAMAEELMREWPYEKLVIDTTAGDWSAYEDKILGYLSLPRKHYAVAPEKLALHVGVYRAEDDAEAVMPVELRGSHLWAKACWPEGSRLLPESETLFNTEGGGDYIEFDAYGLTYMTNGRRRRYRI